MLLGRRSLDAGRHECRGLAVEFELGQLFQQDAGLVGCLDRFAGYFQQGIQLDRVDTDTVFFDLGGDRSRDVVWRGFFQRRDVGGRHRSRCHCFPYASRYHCPVQCFPIQAVVCGDGR